MPDHAQMLAEIERREAIAREATPGPWSSYGTPPFEVVGEPYDDDSVDAPAIVPEVGRDQDSTHIALHDPADALRRYAHYRRILDRHAPSDVENVWEHGESHPACTHGYDDPDDNPEALQWRQCPEIRDLADALGLGAHHDH